MEAERCRLSGPYIELPDSLQRRVSSQGVRTGYDEYTTGSFELVWRRRRSGEDPFRRCAETVCMAEKQKRGRLFGRDNSEPYFHVGAYTVNVPPKSDSQLLIFHGAVQNPNPKEAPLSIDSFSWTAVAKDDRNFGVCGVFSAEGKDAKPTALVVKQKDYRTYKFGIEALSAR